MKRTHTLFLEKSIRPVGFCRCSYVILSRRAFSLVEVVIALSIVSFALIAILGILPLGIASLRDSNTDTTTSLVLPQVRGLILGEEHRAGQDFGPYYFDVSASFIGEETIPSDPNDKRTSYYRVDISMQQPKNQLNNSDLLACVAEISWPTDASGNVPKNAAGKAKNSQVHSFFMTPLTGTGWKNLDPQFEPKIEL
jgi:uncharacterized protein (TIGR02598 family)